MNSQCGCLFLAKLPWLTSNSSGGGQLSWGPGFSSKGSFLHHYQDRVYCVFTSICGVSCFFTSEHCVYCVLASERIYCEFSHVRRLWS